MATLRASGLDEYSGAELVAATNSGETHAFEKLVFRCKRSVFAAAQRITNNREDAEDVVQESIHKAFIHLDDFQENPPFSYWLIHITINEAFIQRSRYT